MTITDEERREVAAKMRRNADDMPFYGDLVADAAGADFMDDEACWKRLADLIEPAPTSSDRGPTCDRDALLELADRVQLIHSDPSGLGREACDYYEIGGDLDCWDCEAYASDSKCLDMAIADVSRRIRAIAKGLEGGSNATLAGDKEQGDTDAHADENEAAEAARTPNIEVLRWINEQGGIEAVKKRLMPDGMEWPTVDGEPVVIGERMRSCGIEGCKVVGIDPASSRLILASDNIEEGKATYFPDSAEYCHRPAPKVLDADGVEIRERDTVYHVKDGSEMTVCGIEGEWLVVSVGGRVRHDIVTHRAPVLAADGEPLEVGQTVWDVKSGIEYEVVGIHTDEDTPVRVMRTDGSHLAKAAKPSSLTHQRPVLAADGKPLREGEHVWHVETGAELVVKELPKPGEYQAVVVFAPPASHLTSFDPDQLAHERPVLDADGVPIREGDTVYVLGFGEPLTVKGFTDDGRVLMSFHDESVCKKLIEQQSEAKS